MKEKGNIFTNIKRVLILCFCLVTVSMNVINYLRSDEDKALGTVFQWSQGLEIAYTERESSKIEPDTDETVKSVETDDFSLVNLNSADIDQLQTLKGIGPAKAAAIIEYRESYGGFVVIEEIMEVPGIGEGIFEKIKDYIVIE